MGGIGFDRVDQVGDQVVTSLQFRIDVRPRLPAVLPQSDQGVVVGNGPNEHQSGHTQNDIKSCPGYLFAPVQPQYGGSVTYNIFYLFCIYTGQYTEYLQSAKSQPVRSLFRDYLFCRHPCGPDRTEGYG